MSQSNPNPPPRAAKNSDEELVAAVKRECESQGVPVVPTKAIAERPDINIKQTQVKRRLDSIAENDDRIAAVKVGRGRVWFPTEGEGRGVIDTSIISDTGVEWGRLDPSEAPDEFVEAILEEHEDTESLSDRLVDGGENFVSVGGITFLLGLGLLVGGEVGVVPIDTGSALELFAAIAVIGGFLFMMVGLGLVYSIRVGRRARTEVEKGDIRRRAVARIYESVKRLEEWLSGYVKKN